MIDPDWSYTPVGATTCMISTVLLCVVFPLIMVGVVKVWRSYRYVGTHRGEYRYWGFQKALDDLNTQWHNQLQQVQEQVFGNVNIRIVPDWRCPDVRWTSAFSRF